MSQESLQIEQDLAYQTREWRIERAGWALMLLLVVLAAAGLFGDGVLSQASVSNSRTKIEYERFLRFSRVTSLKVYVRTRANENRLVVRIDRDFLQANKVENIVPEPIRADLGENFVSYNFAIEKAPEAVIRFDLKPDRIGRLSPSIITDEDDPLAFNQWVYP